MVIGSGPIIIGQLNSTTPARRACRAPRKKRASKSCFVNSNPATIMTDTHIADRVYIEPLTVEFLEEIISKD